MKLSEIIKQLQYALDKHGDEEVRHKYVGIVGPPITGVDIWHHSHTKGRFFWTVKLQTDEEKT